MKNIGNAFKAAAKAFRKSFEPARYSAAGLPIHCTHCKEELFREQEALFNTTGSTLLNLDWLDKSGTVLICEKCGLVQWFARKPEREQN